MHIFASAVAAALFWLPAAGVLQAPMLGDDAIRDAVIAQSIANYAGNCPCPYNRASNGSRCGKRSAYSRPGGASPRCYRSDVSAGEVEDWRRRARGG